MDLIKFISEASQRGEKIKAKLIEDLLNSNLINQLLTNEKFLNGISSLMNTKEEIEKTVQRNLHVVFKYLEVPTRHDIQGMNHKIQSLEHEVQNLQREIVTKKLKKTAKKPQ